MPQQRRLRRRRLFLEQLEDRSLLATLPAGFTLDTVASGFNLPVAFDFAPDGRVYVAEKAGVIQVFDQGTTSTFVDIQSQVNNVHDRGLLGVAVHPEFPSQPYVYALYTFDPPGVTPDAEHSRVSRLTRFTADPATNYATAIPGSEFVMLGNQSTLENIPEPNVRNPEQPACGDIGAYVQDCVPADEISHTIGRVAFGNDGSLFVSSGDGGNVSAAQDYVVRTLDINSLSGKLLRIDPITGEGLADNPFYNGDVDSNQSKVYSLGLRNPFRFAIDPVTAEPFIGDVGWAGWEEINTGRGQNFGWPCYEGGDGASLLQYAYADFPQCQALYQTTDAVPAIYAYPHTGGRSSVQVGDFYQGMSYPQEYHDALFFFDFNSSEVSTMTFAEGRQVDQLALFGSDLPLTVQMSTGPDTNLYLLELGGTLQRLRYLGGDNTPPTVVARQTQSSQFTFDFSSHGTFDPDADELSYLWDFGDGNTSTAENPSHTYVGSGPHTVTLTVSDPAPASSVDTLEVFAGNLPPVPEITLPSDGDTFRIGEAITLAGMADDFEDGPLADAALHWHVMLHHNEHTHFDVYHGTGTSGAFIAEDHGDNVHYEICLEATDAVGVAAETCVEVYPETVDYTFDSSPTGLIVNYSGVDYETPFTAAIPVFATRTVAAPETQEGVAFFGWSDEGEPTHQITTGTSDATLTATFGPEIVLRARGITGNEVLELQIDQQTVASFDVTMDSADYRYVHPEPVSPAQIRAAFVNDYFEPPVNYAVVVDHMTLAGEVYESEHPSVYSQGVWDGSCGGGFKESQRLDCNGYFQFAESGIVIRAAGITGDEIIELQIDEQAVASFNVTPALKDYRFVPDSPVSTDQVRVAFINDVYDPPIDRLVTVDHIKIDGVVYESEHPSVLSTGTWDGASCNAGFKQSEYLHCSGHFHYAEIPPASIVVHARGAVGSEVIDVQIDEVTVATFDLSTDLAAYEYQHGSPLDADAVRVVFTNDFYAPPLDGTVIVDYIEVEGVTYQSEHITVLSTGTWDGSCDAGHKQSEVLNCNGYFEYPILPKTEVLLQAAGVVGTEIIELQLNDVPVATFELTTQMESYVYEHVGPVDADYLRVVFTNDFYAPPLDATVVVDYVAVDGVVFQTEDPGVLSTGTWDGSCDAGYKQSQTLHCSGYFEYDLPDPPPEPEMLVNSGVGSLASMTSQEPLATGQTSSGDATAVEAGSPASTDTIGIADPQEGIAAETDYMFDDDEAMDSSLNDLALLLWEEEESQL